MKKKTFFNLLNNFEAAVRADAFSQKFSGRLRKTIHAEYSDAKHTLVKAILMEIFFFPKEMKK